MIIARIRQKSKSILRKCSIENQPNLWTWSGVGGESGMRKRKRKEWSGLEWNWDPMINVVVLLDMGLLTTTYCLQTRCLSVKVNDCQKH